MRECSPGGFPSEPSGNRVSRLKVALDVLRMCWKLGDEEGSRGGLWSFGSVLRWIHFDRTGQDLVCVSTRGLKFSGRRDKGEGTEGQRTLVSRQ